MKGTRHSEEQIIAILKQGERDARRQRYAEQDADHALRNSLFPSPSALS